jgi:hypothetical protein
MKGKTKKRSTARAGRAGGDVGRFLALPDAEKEAVYASLDREIGDNETVPATADDVRRWKAVVAKGKTRGRPRIGKGSERVNVTIERSLLQWADAYAARNGMSRAQVIAQGIRLLRQ